MSADFTRVAIVERAEGLYHEIVQTFFVDRQTNKVTIDDIAPIAFSPNLDFMIEEVNDNFSVVDLKTHRTRILATGEDLDL
jgi:hypothetical protein